jgi:hypothetical protein
MSKKQRDEQKENSNEGRAKSKKSMEGRAKSQADDHKANSEEQRA